MKRESSQVLSEWFALVEMKGRSILPVVRGRDATPERQKLRRRNNHRAGLVDH
jgi:hypothetical protein